MPPLMASLFSVDAGITLGVIAVVLGILVFTSLPADMVFVGGLAALMLGGVLEANEALAGFGSQGLVTVGALYVVVAGLHETGALRWVSRHVLGSPKGQRRAMIRLVLPVSLFSAFLNNTPVVALYIPVVTEWVKRLRRAPSLFLIPLSYASILGGMCTMIGTSTNLVVNGLYIDRYGGKGLGIFSISLLGISCALAGMFYLVFVAPRLLPVRKESGEEFENPQSYTVEVVVPEDSRFLGTAIKDSSLLETPGGFLVELIRKGIVHSPIRPDMVLRAGDRLIYTGNLAAVRELMKRQELSPASDQLFKLNTPRSERRLVEAVVSHTCPLVGKSIREGRFRQQYNAVVLAMARNGQRVRGSISDKPLRPGDVLLVESHAGFVPRQHDTGDFYLVHELETDVEFRPARAPLALGILLGMVAAAAAGWMSMLEASLLAAGAMLATRCCTPARARRRIEWNVLMVIGAALGLGTALERSGAAAALSSALLSLAHQSPWQALLLVYITTSLFTEVITNNGAVALVFPVAMNTADQLQVSPLPFLMCLMIAGSASFATPIGYQTNLMVYGAGGYKFTDYLRVGIPMNLLVGAVAVGLAPLIWPW